ncbi:ATP-binding protein [Kitasatospora phosalacinea]|uniref:Transcriptional activator n=1 Tax=Kitasatospora phosalacinea TaxID=2065 RepID=A0A9W6PBR0_9ACTN|nr:AAA family ATPase [Kitasatospora phosalacinea]GLW52084.1 transcriptional activator [Kitasatospora phosalacinea]
MLRLYLFEGFRAERDSGPPLAERWPRPGARALVKVLAVAPGHRLHREEVMDLCWPDADPAAAAGSLRVALHAARHALEPELAPRAASSYLKADGGLLLLDPTAVWIDADHAEQAAEDALADGRAERLADAIRQFTGELLPEDRYAHWAGARRTRLAQLCEQLLLRLASAHLDQDRPEDAAACAEQVLATSPAEELAHRLLIDACLRQGQRRRALRQYHQCREVLDAELGIRPGPETERLHRAALAAAPAPAPAGAALPARLRSAAPARLHGREVELGRLLDPAGPPVRLLTGEAGIGKTRLAAEAARRAAADGSAVLWGSGQDAEDHTPYGVFAAALDGWLAEHDPAERARVGAEYPELAAFLPSLGQVPTGAARSPEEERDRLFRAGAALLGDLAATRPVLVVLDDLHAADTGSYQLLGHLARRAHDRRTPLRFLATYREEELPDGDARRRAVAALLRQQLAVREELGRLDQAAVLAAVRDATGRPPRPDVWELSLGNPLFALELARGGGPEDDPAHPPAGVRDLVGERLLKLDPAARRFVEALSVAGVEAALAELLDVAEHGLHPPVTGAAAADAVEHAIAAALIEERQVVTAGRAEAGLAFRHPLVRLTCYDGLSAVRRRQLHTAYAQAVQRRRPDAVDALASHFTRADDPRAADYLRRAAERAAALYANDTADRYYRDLVARLDVDAARARLAHSQVLRRMGEPGRAADVLRTALAEFLDRGDHDDTVATAAHLAEALFRAGELDEALAVLAAHPPQEHAGPEARALHHLARSNLDKTQGHYQDAYLAARRAQDPAERVPGPNGQLLQARSHATQAINLGLAGRFGEARRAGDRALAPAQAYGDPVLLGSVLSTLRENARRHGRLHDAVRFGRQALDHARQSGDPLATAFEQLNLAELHLLLEENDTAAQYAEAAVAAADWDDAWSLPYALAVLARVLLRTGDTARAAALLERAGTPGDEQAHHEVRRARALLALRGDDPATALAVLGADAAERAPELAAYAHLAAGRPAEAARIAAAEATRAHASGERLAETEALIAHATAATRLGDDATARTALTRADHLTRTLPYPSGHTRVLALHAELGERT